MRRNIGNFLAIGTKIRSKLAVIALLVGGFSHQSVVNVISFAVLFYKPRVVAYHELSVPLAMNLR